MFHNILNNHTRCNTTKPPNSRTYYTRRKTYHKRCSVRLYLHVLLFSNVYLRYLCLFAYCDVQQILCCVLLCFDFVLCTLCWQFLWIVNFWLPLWYSLTFIVKMTATKCESWYLFSFSFSRASMTLLILKLIILICWQSKVSP